MAVLIQRQKTGKMTIQFKNSIRMTEFIDKIIRAFTERCEETYRQICICGQDREVSALMSRIATLYSERNPGKRVIRTNGRDFCSAVIEAYLHDAAHMTFDDNYADCDLFIMESLQVLAGHGAAMMHFFTIFDRIYEKGGKIAVGCDIPPSHIPRLDTRIITQLEGGIVCNVEEHGRIRK